MMKELSLSNLMKACLDEEKLFEALVNAIADEIDYNEIALNLIDDMDIQEEAYSAAKEMFCPF